MRLRFYSVTFKLHSGDDIHTHTHSHAGDLRTRGAAAVSADAAESTAESGFDFHSLRPVNVSDVSGCLSRAAEWVSVLGDRGRVCVCACVLTRLCF